jgi:phosphonate transport system permease protein
VTGQSATQPRTQVQLGPGFSWTNALLVIAGFIVLGWSFHGSQFSIVAPFEPNNVKSVVRFVGGLFPPDFSPPFLATIGRLMLETIQISIVGTALAITFGFLLAIGAMRRRGEDNSRNALGTIPWVSRWATYSLSRGILNMLRAVPELVWALIFVVAVGLGPFPGVLALGAHSAGVLGKLYAELFESVDQRLVEAGRSTGGTDLGVLLMVQLPAMLPVLLSYTLFRWECNMRAATLLGFVGAGGIGSQLIISMKLYQYNEVATLALSILLLVVLVDVVGQVIRSRVLDAPTNACAPLLADQ